MIQLHWFKFTNPLNSCFGHDDCTVGSCVLDWSTLDKTWNHN